MALSSSVKADLGKAVKSPVLWDAPLSAWTTFRIGGPADALVTVNGTEELQAVLSLCGDKATAWCLLGRGSNVLAADEGYPGVIIVLGDGFRFVDMERRLADGRILIKAGAALGLSRLAEWAAEHGLSGLEFAAGIPGSLGGALVMNAGAWGSDVGSLVHELFLAGRDTIMTVPARDLDFGYRCLRDIGRSLSGYVVTGTLLELVEGETLEIRKKMKEFRTYRRDRQPSGMANAGSFFKNPAGDSAGRLIETSGLKGLRVGDAEVSEKHGNFFVNRGRATARDMIALMHRVQEAVKRDSNIDLEPEVQFL